MKRYLIHIVIWCGCFWIFADTAYSSNETEEKASDVSQSPKTLVDSSFSNANKVKPSGSVSEASSEDKEKDILFQDSEGLITDKMLPLVKSDVSLELTEEVPFTPDHPFNRALLSAYQKNPQLRVQANQQYATNEQVPTALSGYRPTIAFNASMGETRQGSNTSSLSSSGTVVTTRPVAGELSISQPLYDGGKTMHGVARAEKEVLAGFATFSDTEQQILLNAAQAYFNLWLAKATLDLQTNNVKAKKKRMLEVRARYEVGDLTVTDLAQAESELADAFAQRIVAEGQVKNAKATYVRVIGEDPKELIPPPFALEVFDIPKDKLSIINLALKNNPFLQAALHNKDVAAEALYVTEGDLLPSVSAEGTAQKNLESSSPNGRSETFSVLVRLRIPLYQSGAEWSAVRAATHQVTQAKANVMVARQQLIELVETVLDNVESSKGRIDQLHFQIRAAQLTLEGITQENLVGERTLSDVYDAENKVFQVKSALLQAIQDKLLGGFQVMAATGLMTIKSLGIPAEPYGIKEHYESVRTKLIGLGDKPKKH